MRITQATRQYASDIDLINGLFITRLYTAWHPSHLYHNGDE